MNNDKQINTKGSVFEVNLLVCTLQLYTISNSWKHSFEIWISCGFLFYRSNEFAFIVIGVHSHFTDFFFLRCLKERCWKNRIEKKTKFRSEMIKMKRNHCIHRSHVSVEWWAHTTTVLQHMVERFEWQATSMCVLFTPMILIIRSRNVCAHSI